METTKKDTYSILVVDDSHDIAQIMKLHLQDTGYKTLITTTASDVFTLLAEYNFKLALIDINMPGINGLDILDFMHKELPYIPVIMLTAHGSEAIAVDAMKRGATDYLSKPFALEEMQRKVESALLVAAKIPVTINVGELFEQTFGPDIVKGLENMKIHMKPEPIIKSIEFDEDAYQAGVSILAYFSTIVKQKYPDTKVKVKIEQENQTVRLIVETPDGEREKIERTLNEYGMVVVGEMNPEELLPNKIQEMQLRHKLDMAIMEVSHSKELLAFSQTSHKNEIAHLTEEVQHLKEQIREAFKREDHAREVLLKMIDLHAADGDVKDAIIKLSNIIGSDLQQKDKEIILELLTIIKNRNTSAYEDIKAYMISSFGGATGNLLSSWLPMIFAALSR